MGTLTEVKSFLGQDGTSDEINTKIFFIIPDPLRLCKRSIVLADFSKKEMEVENFKNLNFCVFHPIWVKFVTGVTLGKDKFGMATAIFWPTQQTNQSLMANLF